MELNIHVSPAYLFYCRSGILKMSKYLLPPRCCGCCCRNDDDTSGIICDSKFCEGNEQQRIDAFYSYIFSGRHNYHHHNNKDKEKRMKMKERKKMKDRKNDPPRQLPLDILAEIIVRLPGTTILKLSSVCKDWYTISRDSSITARALLQANDNKAYIAIHRGQENDRVDLIQGKDVTPLKPLSKYTTIIGSSNGILCCLKRNYDNNANVNGGLYAYQARRGREYANLAKRNSLNVDVIGGGGDLYLYNPLLGSRRRGCCRLPLPGVPIEIRKWSTLLIKYGFGFDNIRSEFKVVRFVVQSFLIVQTCVVPMQGNSTIGTPQPWKTIKLDLDIKIGFDRDDGLAHEPLSLVKGKLHYLSCNSNANKSKIISFDIASEEILVLEDIFNFEGDNNDILRIGELGGRLFAITTQYFRNDCFDLWVMKDYGDPKSWAILLSMRQLSIRPQAPFMIPYQLFNKDGDELLLIAYSVHNYMVRHAPTIVSIPPHPQNKMMFKNDDGLLY